MRRFERSDIDPRDVTSEHRRVIETMDSASGATQIGRMRARHRVNKESYSLSPICLLFSDLIHCISLVARKQLVTGGNYYY